MIVSRAFIYSRSCSSDRVPPEQRLESCTWLIESLGLTRHGVAALYANRGWVYNGTGSYDRAIADLDKRRSCSIRNSRLPTRIRVGL
jgi:hypothetical protein